MIRSTTHMGWGSLLVALLVGMVGAASALWHMPLAQGVRWLPAISGGALHGLSAEGLWHEGSLALGCATPNGRLLDCGHYAVEAGWQMGEGGPVRWSARQPGGGVLRARLGGFAPSSWQIELKNLRLPMAALSIGLPIAEQMQLGGDVWVDGPVSGSGNVALTLRWQSEFGEFSTGEQHLRFEGGANRYELRFLPPAGSETLRKVSLEGKIDCEVVSGKAGARCRGEVIVVTDRSVPKLESLLLASAPQVSPGRYRLRVDAR